MRGVVIGRGVAWATILAGPLFGLAASVGDVLSRGQAPGGVGVLLGMMLMAVPFGAILAIVPNLLGAALLALLGRGNVGVRLPVLWALVGAGAGASIGALAGTEGAAVMAAVGAACALICRSGVRWAD